MNTRQVPDTLVRKQMWKLVSAVSAMVSAFLAKTLIKRAYQAIRKEEPASAFDPNSARFSWPNALVWAAAAGIGLITARIVSTRLATIGWEAATGTLPPGAVEQSPAG